MQKTEIIRLITNLKLKEYIYSIIFLCYAIIIGGIFIYSIAFLSITFERFFNWDKNLTEKLNATSLNLHNYELLADKLGIDLSAPSNQPSSTLSSTTPTEQSSDLATRMLLRIAIFNSTKTPGLAGGLKKTLVDSGFKVVKIGNQSPALATTTINLSPEVVNHPDLAELKSILTTQGLLFIENLLPETGKYDFEIVIGNH